MNRSVLSLLLLTSLCAGCGDSSSTQATGPKAPPPPPAASTKNSVTPNAERNVSPTETEAKKKGPVKTESPSPSNDTGVVALRWIFKPQMKLLFEEIQKSRIDTTGIPTTQTMDRDVEMTVLEVLPNGDAKIRLVVTRMKFHIESQAIGEFSYDSTTGAEPVHPMWEMIGPGMVEQLNNPITFVMSPTGDVRDFNIPNSLIVAFDSQPQLKQMGVTAESVVQRFDQWLTTLPEEPVANEAAWRKQVSQKSYGGMYILTTDYKLVNHDQGTVRIDAKMESTIAPDQGELRVNFSESKSDYKIVFDAKLGAMREHKHTSKALMDMNISNTFIEQEIHEETTVTLKSVSGG